MFVPVLSFIRAEAGNQRRAGPDSRLRGNDIGIGFVKTSQGSIFGVVTAIVAFNIAPIK
jgi:hypothetical protein